MSVILEKINPRFRELTDLLFFSNRMDIDLAEYKTLLKSNYNPHYAYLWDRFNKAIEISWEEGEIFWSNRLDFIFSLEEKSLIKLIEPLLEKRMFGLVKSKLDINPKYDIAYLQFIEYCKVKYKRGESLLSIKNNLLELTSQTNINKLLLFINSFIPYIFTDINQYSSIVSKNIIQSARNLSLLQALELQGAVVDKTPIVNLARDIITKRVHNDKNRRAFLAIINDPSILVLLKKEYLSSHQTNLIEFLQACDFRELEENYLQNIKNILELDNSIADELAIIYANKLYIRHSGHKKANADKIIKLLKTFPQISTKKILSYLSSNNKISDIKYVILAFPELKKLAAFV